MPPETCCILHDKGVEESEQLLEAKRLFERLVQRPTDSVPRLLKRHYLKEILDWILTRCLSLRKDGIDLETLKGSWELLHAVLSYCGSGQWGGFAPGLNQCVVKNVSRYSEMMTQSSELGNRSEILGVLKGISQLLELLAEQEVQQYTIHLEHASKIMESSLQMLYKNMQSASDEEQACVCLLARESCKIFEGHLDRFTNQKKLWEAVMQKQFGMLLITSFNHENAMVDPETQGRCRHILERVLYNPESVDGIIEWLSSGLEESRKTRHYSSKLFTELEACMDSLGDDESQRAFTSGIEWIISGYKNRFDGILHQENSNDGKGSRASLESQVRRADILFVLAILDMIVKRAEKNSIEKSFLIACLRSLTHVVKKHNIYRPLENDVENKRERIEKIAAIVREHGLHDPNASNCLVIVQNAVQTLLDISSIEQHGSDALLYDIWRMVNMLGLQEGGIAHCPDAKYDLAVKLIAQYASFRRLDTLLKSLQKSLYSFSMVGAIKLLCNSEVLEAWKENCKSAPTGQSVLILALLGEFLNLYSDSESINGREKVLYEFLGAFVPVIINNIPVIMENAKSVSEALELLIQTLGNIMVNNLEDETQHKLVSILKIYESCLSVHAVCCGMIPRLRPLTCQETRPPFSEATVDSGNVDRYFLPLAGKNDAIEGLSLHSMCQRLNDTVASTDMSVECNSVLLSFASALSACIMSRLEVLYEQITYKENICYDEDVASLSSGCSDGKKEYSMLVKDLSRMIWLVGLLPSSAHLNGRKDICSFSKENETPKGIILLIVESKVPLYHLLSCLDKRDQQQMVDTLISSNLGHQMFSNQQWIGHEIEKECVTRANIELKQTFKECIALNMNNNKGKNRKRKRDSKEKIIMNMIKMPQPQIDKMEDSKSAWTEILDGIDQFWKNHNTIWSVSPPTKEQCETMWEIIIKHSSVVVFFSRLSWKMPEMNHMLLWSITLHLLYLLVQTFCCHSLSDSAIWSMEKYILTDILEEGLALEKKLCQMETVPLSILDSLKQSQQLRVRLIDILFCQISSKNATFVNNEPFWDWMVSLRAWRKYLASKAGTIEPDLLSNTDQMPASLKGALDLSVLEGALAGVISNVENGSITYEEASAPFLSAMKTYEAAVACIHGHAEQEDESIFFIASVASFASQAVEWYSKSSLYSDALEKHLFPSLVSVFQACIRQSSHHLITLQADNHACVACLLDIVSFMQSFTRISFQTRPRVSWKHYCSLLSAYLYLISLCGCGCDFGEGHMVRPNAPKEAMFAQASGSGANSTILRELFKGLQIIISESSREELTQLLQKLFCLCSSTRGPCWRIYSSSIINLFLAILEEDKNPVLTDYVKRQGGEILSNLSCLAQSEAFQDFNAENMPGKFSCQELMVDIKSIFLTESMESQTLGLSEIIETPETIESLNANLANICRAMESIFCRPARFSATVIPVRYICMVLNSIPCMVGSLSRGIQNPQQLNPAFMNICHLLTGIIRHRASNLTRSMHLLTACIGSLQHFVTAAACHASMALGFPNSWLEALSRLQESFASLKSSSRYCSDLLFNYIILMASPLSQTSIHRLEYNFDIFYSNPITWKQFQGSRPFFNAARTSSARAALPSRETKGQDKLLEPGACALYGACSPNDLEYLFTKLGGTESTSLWRLALSEIKGIYESQYKYIGKV